jgi:hypothetical protein
MIAVTVKFMPKDIFDQCRLESELLWKSSKPKRWRLAIPIVLIWLFVAFIIVKAVIR